MTDLFLCCSVFLGCGKLVHVVSKAQGKTSQLCSSFVSLYSLSLFFLFFFFFFLIHDHCVHGLISITIRSAGL